MTLYNLLIGEAGPLKLGIDIRGKHESASGLAPHPIDEVVRSEAFKVQLAQLAQWGLLPAAREDSR